MVISLVALVLAFLTAGTMIMVQVGQLMFFRQILRPQLREEPRVPGRTRDYDQAVQEAAGPWYSSTADDEPSRARPYAHQCPAIDGGWQCVKPVGHLYHHQTATGEFFANSTFEAIGS